MSENLRKEDVRWAALTIAADIKGRKGIGDEWDMIDSDIRNEIIDEWCKIITYNLEN